MLTDRQRKILEEQTPYIIRRVKSYRFIPPLEFDSAVSYVLDKICNQIKNYNQKRRLMPFLNKLIRDNVKDYYKKLQHEPIEINENRIYETNTPETDYWQDRENKILHEEIDKLDSENKQIVELYYFSKYTEEKIGKKVGLARNTISVRLKKSLAKIRPRIEERLIELEKLKEEL